MYHTTTPSSVFLDDSGPRPLPSYLRQPPPPPTEKVFPCVPDVSLIFGQGLDRRPLNFTTLIPTTAVNENQMKSSHIKSAEKQTSCNSPLNSSQVASDSLLLKLISLVEQQSLKIEKIESQLEKLMNLNIKKIPKQCEIAVQTNDVGIFQKRDGNQRMPEPSYEMQRENGNDVSGNHTEDLSKILKDLQLPITTDQSMYSVHNSPHVDLPEFMENNNPLLKSEVENSPGIGPSVSEYGSSDDEEAEIQPTVTYYRNVLGNVNRLLDNHSTPPPRLPKPRNRTGIVPNGGLASHEAQNHPNNNLMIQQNVYNSIFIPNGNSNGAGGNDRAPEPLPRNFLPRDTREPTSSQNCKPGTVSNTDVTMYGMSSANLSFATRDYLERHGLYSGSSQQPMISNGRPSNRVLDSGWQNHPKFL